EAQGPETQRVHVADRIVVDVSVQVGTFEKFYGSQSDCAAACGSRCKRRRIGQRVAAQPAAVLGLIRSIPREAQAVTVVIKPPCESEIAVDVATGLSSPPERFVREPSTNQTRVINQFTHRAQVVFGIEVTAGFRSGFYFDPLTGKSLRHRSRCRP